MSQHRDAERGVLEDLEEKRDEAPAWAWTACGLSGTCGLAEDLGGPYKAAASPWQLFTDEAVDRCRLDL